MSAVHPTCANWYRTQNAGVRAEFHSGVSHTDWSAPGHKKRSASWNSLVYKDVWLPNESSNRIAPRRASARKGVSVRKLRCNEPSGVLVVRPHVEHRAHMPVQAEQLRNSKMINQPPARAGTQQSSDAARSSSAAGSAAAQRGASGQSANAATPPSSDIAGELKSEIDRLSAIMPDVLQRRARQAAATVDDGLTGARHIIRENPWISIGVAGLLGAGLAIATTARGYDDGHLRRLQRRARRSLAGLDAGAFLPSANSLRGYIPDLNASAPSLADRFERLGDAISGIDPAATKTPLMEAAQHVQALLRRAKS